MIVTTYSLAASIFALLIGPLSDRIGRKKVLILGLTLFTLSSIVTYFVSSLASLLIVRMLTGLSAGALSTGSLSYAADHYAYSLRGRAMGILSMSYFASFAIGVPLGAVVASRWGWSSVFGGLAITSLLVLIGIAFLLPNDSGRSTTSYSLHSLGRHFFKADRLSGMIAAFFTSGGIVGFLTYLGSWLSLEHGVSIDRIGLVFVASGLAAAAASPIAGWLADHAGKRSVIVMANLALAVLFAVVARLEWGVGLFVAIGGLSIAASSRQGPLHALTTELVGAEIRGEYIALRNAASQLGVAVVAAASAAAYQRGGFQTVSTIAAISTLLVPLTCIWLKEPDHAR